MTGTNKTSELEDMKTIISGIMDEIDEMKSNIEYDYSWRNSFLRDLDIPKELKKRFGYTEDNKESSGDEEEEESTHSQFCNCEECENNKVKFGFDD